MLGIGRFGGIAGSFLVGELAQLSSVAIPGVTAALALVVN